jgi:hypothetical protein
LRRPICGVDFEREKKRGILFLLSADIRENARLEMIAQPSKDEEEKNDSGCVTFFSCFHFQQVRTVVNCCWAFGVEEKPTKYSQ